MSNEQGLLDTTEALVKNAAVAGVAQLVEHQLAMLDVASSNLVSRSILNADLYGRRSCWIPKTLSLDRFPVDE